MAEDKDGRNLIRNGRSSLLKFESAVWIDVNQLVTREEVAILTQSAVDDAIRKIEIQKKEDAANPENYAWWENYVLNSTGCRIEALYIP